MMAPKHTAGLHRGYSDNVRVEWERRGKGGHSSITLLNATKRPVAVLLGDYVPGEIDADMDGAARLFSAAPDLLSVVQAFLLNRPVIHTEEPFNGALNKLFGMADDAAAKATGESAQ